MNLLKTVLADSFTILTRNFTLIYPLLFCGLVLPMVFPQEGLPRWEPRWIVMTTLMLLIFFAFLAGGCHMIYRACRHFILFEKPTEMKQQQGQAPEAQAPEAPEVSSKSDDLPGPALMNSFLLLREFFPGVGEYFGRFTLGGMMNVGVLVALYLEVKSGIDNLNLVPHLFEQFQALAMNPGTTPVEMERFILNLSVAERAQLAQVSNHTFLALSVYGVFSMLTMFWPAFVMLQQRSAPGAYWQSIRQCFRDPIRVLIISGLFFSINMLGTFTLQLVQNVVLLSLWQFLAFIILLYFGIVLFMYIIHAQGLPPTSEEAASKANQADTRTESTPV